MEKLPTNISHNLNFEASVGVSTMSILTFLSLSILLVFYNRGDALVKGWGSPNNLVLIFLGVLITTVTSLCIPSYDEEIYKVYIIILLLWIGILVTALGAFYFFAHPKVSYIDLLNVKWRHKELDGCKLSWSMWSDKIMKNIQKLGKFDNISENQQKSTTAPPRASTIFFQRLRGV